jgi:hypothetical protein
MKLPKPDFRKSMAVRSLVIALMALASVLGADRGVRDKELLRRYIEGKKEQLREITGRVRRGETVTAIFRKYNLKIDDLFRMREAAAGVHRLRNIVEGRPYRILVDPDNSVVSLAYHINNEEMLRIVRLPPGYYADRIAIECDRQIPER